MEISIEALIYASGVSCIMALLIFAVSVLVGASALIIKRVIFKELRSVYLHAQLRHFMKVLMKKGYSGLASDAEKFGYKVMTKDSCDN